MTLSMGTKANADVRYVIGYGQIRWLAAASVLKAFKRPYFFTMGQPAPRTNTDFRRTIYPMEQTVFTMFPPVGLALLIIVCLGWAIGFVPVGLPLRISVNFCMEQIIGFPAPNLNGLTASMVVFAV